MPSQATRPPLVGMPAAWLRDNCPCPLCRDPVSGQRLPHIADIPADIAVAEVVPSGRTVSVLFHPDGHRAVFDRDWLARHGEPARTGFAHAGRRHLQGCYSDLDGVESAVAVGERATTGVIRRKDGT
jgi:DUF971 family protein